MDRNTLIGIGLIILIFIGVTVYNMPSEAERARLQHGADSLAAVEIDEQQKLEQLRADSRQKAGQASDTAAAHAALAKVATDTIPDSLQVVNADSLSLVRKEQKFGIFHPASEGRVEDVVLDNGKVQVSISTHGAHPSIMRLKEYR